MKSNHTLNALDGTLKCGAVLLAVLQVFAAVPQPAYAAPVTEATPKTTTPIKNVIIIIGENRTFDHVYGTYVPKKGQTVSNLVSVNIDDHDEGIGVANNSTGTVEITCTSTPKRA